MGRAALTADDREAFRAALRDAATRLFAAHGEAGVTMRALADELDVSPMTPYRYVRDRDEVFTMVRVAAVTAFVDAVERAAASERDPVRRIRALGRAYIAFAVARPDLYRVMFLLELEGDRDRIEVARLDKRAWSAMRTAVGDAIASSALAGDADTVAHLAWAAVHGLVMLHLAGKLRLGRTLDALLEPTLDSVIAGAQPTRRPR